MGAHGPHAGCYVLLVDERPGGMRRRSEPAASPGAEELALWRRAMGEARAASRERTPACQRRSSRLPTALRTQRLQ